MKVVILASPWKKFRGRAVALKPNLGPRPFLLFDYPQKSGDAGYLRTLLAYLTVFYPLHDCIFTYSIHVR